MSQRVTLGDARASTIPKVIDLCVDDPRVAEYINKAQRTLLDCGKWAGTTQRIRICLSNACLSGCNTTRCLTLPREVASVEGITMDGHPIMLRNNFFEFLPYGPGQADGSCCGWISCDGFQRDNAATYNDIIPPNKGLRVYPTNAADVGKTVTFFGIDDNGIPIVGGIVVTLALPYTQSVVAMQAITDVQKEITIDRVLVYELNMAAVDPGDWTQRSIAIYAPGETRPNYQRYCLPDNCCRSANRAITTVLALVKLGYVAAVADKDYLIIGNLDALELMCQAIRAKENGNLGGYEAFMRDAIKQLNRELRTETGDRLSIDFPVFGSAKLSRRIRGFI